MTFISKFVTLNKTHYKLHITDEHYFRVIDYAFVFLSYYARYEISYNFYFY